MQVKQQQQPQQVREKPEAPAKQGEGQQKEEQADVGEGAEEADASEDEEDEEEEIPRGRWLAQSPGELYSPAPRLPPVGLTKDEQVVAERHAKKVIFGERKMPVKRGPSPPPTGGRAAEAARQRRAEEISGVADHVLGDAPAGFPQTRGYEALVAKYATAAICLPLREAARMPYPWGVFWCAFLPPATGIS